MATLLRGAQLIEFEPASVEVGDLRIRDGLIVARAARLEAEPDDEVIDLTGKLLAPGLVSAHHHPEAVLMRGLLRRSEGFGGEAALRAEVAAMLTPDDVYAATRSSALEGLLAGTTSTMAVHPAGARAEGLTRMAEGFDAIGLRAAIGWQAAGAGPIETQLEVLRGLVDSAPPRVSPVVAVTGLDVLSDGAIDALVKAAATHGLMVALSIGEDPSEEARCQKALGVTATERARDRGLLGPKTVVAHAVNQSWPELSVLLSHGCWMAHCPRTNMATQAGAAAAAKFGVRACLGTGTLPLDVMDELHVAWLKSSEAQAPVDALRMLANGHRLASALFDRVIGPLREGAVADLVVHDYLAPSPLDSTSLAQHVLHGFSATHVESVMIDGVWRLWKRKPLGLTVIEAAKHAREAASGLWARLGTR
jgi:cytosine/adenosine deaminase-related metal-dependent hydrolase